MGSVRIITEDFSIDEVCKEIMTPGTGGIVTFLGVVRGEEGERRTISMEVESYMDMAERELGLLRERAMEEYGLEDMSIIHRVGSLSSGENIVIIAAAGPHRAECFDAARFIIDEIKRRVPIWKKEISPEGERWVEGEH
jgi:molybdopterin synthase catalytic subunit